MFKSKNSALPPSSCGLAFDDRNGEIVIAEHGAAGGFDIFRVVVGEQRAVDLRASDLRTTLSNGNAHTDARLLPVSFDAPEELILNALIESTDNDESIALAYTQTPDARILVTQVEEIAVAQLIRRVETWLDQQQPQHIQLQPKTLRIETRTRAITRLWRSTQGSNPPSGSTAFLVIGDHDYAVGLWSEENGLVYETEETFERGARNEIKCEHARDVFIKFIAAASLAKLKLPEVTNAVLSAADSYGDLMLSFLQESPELDRINLEPISIDLGEATRLDQPLAFAIGSLLDQETIPACNVAATPAARLTKIAQERELRETAHQSSKVRAAMLSLLIPFVAVLAFVLAAWIDNNVETARLNSRVEEETQLGQQLARANSDYESSKANFAAFQSLLDNLIALRQKQPAAHQLLNDLNQRWPQDPSWSVSEINVKGSSVEIKGRTKNEQAITSFAKSLEFSNGLFTGILTRNNVEGSSANTVATPAQTPRSSMIEFTVLSAYTPLASPNANLNRGTTSPQPLPARPFTGPSDLPAKMPGQNTGPQLGQPVTTRPSGAPSLSPVTTQNLPVPQGSN